FRIEPRRCLQRPELEDWIAQVQPELRLTWPLQERQRVMRQFVELASDQLQMQGRALKGRGFGNECEEVRILQKKEQLVAQVQQLAVDFQMPEQEHLEIFHLLFGREVPNLWHIEYHLLCADQV